MKFKELLSIKLFIVLSVGFLLPVIIFCLVLVDRSPWSSKVVLKNLPEIENEKIEIGLDAQWYDVDGIIVFAGDIIQHARQKGTNFDKSYLLVKDELAVADIIIGYLEIQAQVIVMD